ncbi:hypothetical protein M8312_08765 [Sphingomonas sp. KRR8]|uniref:hypothetical protein n=1 Tax=Sphingomonas sp. KRR8 TaxID=2942996 RepID=UPI0020226A62|nr:hypothetical protein [Sphingomonas sp. KRR8]URD59901.1 hypothetical protein M8312_08765 [Sphingomonas sp. KRR8]
MSTSLPWTKFQDFYLRLGFLKVLVAVLGTERRSVPTETILRRLRRPLFEDAIAHRSLAERVGERLSWYEREWWREPVVGKKTPTVAEALVVDADLPSLLFAITAPTTYKIVDWARNVGLLGRGNQITERGLTLRALFADTGVDTFLGGDPEAWNPFALTTVERIFFLYHVIEIDSVTLALIDAIGACPESRDIETIDAAKMLAAALSSVLSGAEDVIRPPEIPAYRTALELTATIFEELGMPPPGGVTDARRRAPKPMNPAARRKALLAGASGSEARRTHKNADHQTIPRFEQLVDLGFLTKERCSGDLQARRKWRWHPTSIALRWTSARERLADRTAPFLWDGFAEVSCHAYGGIESPERRIDTATIATYLARGYRAVRRSVGHTPFDSAALMAMAFGVEDGLAIEMVDFHRMMLVIKIRGLLQGEVFFASGNTLDKMFVSLREDFAERVVAVLPERVDWEKEAFVRDGAA